MVTTTHESLKKKYNSLFYIQLFKMYNKRGNDRDNIVHLNFYYNQICIYLFFIFIRRVCTLNNWKMHCCISPIWSVCLFCIHSRSLFVIYSTTDLLMSIVQWCGILTLDYSWLFNEVCFSDILSYFCVIRTYLTITTENAGKIF